MHKVFSSDKWCVDMALPKRHNTPPGLFYCKRVLMTLIFIICNRPSCHISFNMRKQPEWMRIFIISLLLHVNILFSGVTSLYEYTLSFEIYCYKANKISSRGYSKSTNLYPQFSVSSRTPGRGVYKTSFFLGWINKTRVVCTRDDPVCKTADCLIWMF